jgi:hypothetical protein
MVLLQSQVEVWRQPISTYLSSPPTHAGESLPQPVSLIQAMVYPVLSHTNVMQNRPYALKLEIRNLDL